jgi:hypothetical protein
MTKHGRPKFLWQMATIVIQAGSRTARGKITVSGVPNGLNNE